MSTVPATPKPVYKKLTRMRRGLGQMSQLWLGDDHLLLVRSTGYTEDYRRFYLRDIQSMLIVHTNARLYIALALIGPAGIVALILASAGSNWIGYAVLAAIFLPLLIWNQLIGPACRVVVITAVQQEKIGALSRLPKTRRVLAELKPRIEQAQADLLAVPAAAPGPETPAPAMAEPPVQPPPLAPSEPPPLPS